MVTGIRLVYSLTKDFFCAPCVYVKATRKPEPKMRESERADVFGGEVHLNLWGKAPVKSRGGKKYYITFIDDKTQLNHLYLLAKNLARRMKLLNVTSSMKPGSKRRWAPKSKS